MLSWMHTMVFSFFFNDTATTEIYTLSLHDALPIYRSNHVEGNIAGLRLGLVARRGATPPLPSTPPARTARTVTARSEEHTSELQSQSNLVCRLLLEKKN